MLFSTTTMTFYTHPILEALKIIAQCGFDCAEIWVDHAWDQTRGARPQAIKEALNRLSLVATVHCPIMDINITSPNQGIREESIRQSLVAIDFAKEIGARLIVIHPGHKFSPKESSEEHWCFQVQAIQRIFTYAETQGVVATLENMDSDKDIVSVKDHLDLLRLFKDAEIKNGLITLDTTHLRTTVKVLEFVEAVGKQIAHLHFSDATTEQMHLRLGEGQLRLPRIVEALHRQSYDGICSLECFIANQDQELLQQELEKARSLWS